jgi:glycerol-3-phosphate dehydrogenase (NAD+)
VYVDFAVKKMVGNIETMGGNLYSNGSIQNGNGLEEKLDEFRRLLGKADGDPLRIVGVGAGAWGSVFAALLQDNYGQYREKVQIRIWRRPGRAVDRATAEHLFEVINSREDVLRRLIRRCAYLKYVEARLGDRTLYADEILKDGFCLNMIDTPLCPLKVVTNLQEAVWDADIVVNGLPSTETREVFEEISNYWKERITVPIIISLAKGIEAALDPVPHIITPTQMIKRASKNSLSLSLSALQVFLYDTSYLYLLIIDKSEQIFWCLFARKEKDLTCSGDQRLFFFFFLKEHDLLKLYH